MALSETEQQAMISATREMAWNMVEDVEHIRETLLKPEPTQRDLRHMSNVLRRLLIDDNGDLRKFAAPRIGRVHLLVPDILPLIKSSEKRPFPFFSGGTATLFGIQCATMMMDTGRPPREVPNYHPDKTVEVKIDGYLNQQVICFQGQWVSRRQTMKYIAHIAGGVHSGSPKEPHEILLHRIRHAVTMSLENGMPSVNFDDSVFGFAEKPLAINRKSVDFVLIQLLSSAQYLTLSPDVMRLEKIVKAEEA